MHPRPSLPPTVAILLAAATDDERDAAWADFLAEYSRLVLHVARARGGDGDAAMDRYAWVLDALRHDGHRRLRAFAAEGRGSFTTWLVAVVRRLCVDEHRHRYGRPQGGAPERGGGSAWSRRELVDLVGAALEPDELTDSADTPDLALVRAEERAALAEVLARLDPAERLLLRLRYEDGLSVPEIARLQRAPSPFHVYRRLGQLLDRLRAALQRVGVDPPAV